MSFILYIAIGIVIGGLAAWFIAQARAEKRARECESSLMSAEGARAASEALLGELREQAWRREEELKNVRAMLDTERREKTEALTRFEEAQKNLAEQKALLEAMKKELSDTFAALSRSALESSNEAFLTLAGERLGKVVEETKGKLGEHQAAMDGLVKPLQDALKEYKDHIHQIEVRRGEDYKGLDAQIKMLASTHSELRKETSNLVTALRKPHVRGSWGEVTLKNVVELAGMSAHCDFTEQMSFTTDEGRLRPDLVVHLPGGRDLAVDSKVSIEALLDASSVQTEDARRECLRRHAAQVKAHMAGLSAKSYWAQFSRSPEFVVMFISEAALSAAVEIEPGLIEDGLAKRVLIATPTTLFAVLKAVAYGWKQEQVAENADAIAKLGRELYERVAVWAKHLGEVGAALGKATESYNKSVGSMEFRILPSVRKFRELGAASGGEIAEVKQIDQSPRSIQQFE